MKELFYQPIKVTAAPEDILFTGCPHIGHDPKWPVPIWRTRGYESAAEYTEGFVAHWNAKASERTIGFMLGDICFDDPKGERFEGLMDRLNFSEMYVMPGNHTSGFRQAFEKCQSNLWHMGSKTVIFTPNYLEAFINKRPVVMSHYPILSWNGQARSSFMLFSHVHAQLGRSALGKAYEESGARCLEVSVEKFPSPPNFKEVCDILLARQPVSFDHHDSRTNNPF